MPAILMSHWILRWHNPASSFDSRLMRKELVSERPNAKTVVGTPRPGGNKHHPKGPRHHSAVAWSCEVVPGAPGVDWSAPDQRQRICYSLYTGALQRMRSTD